MRIISAIPGADLYLRLSIDSDIWTERKRYPTAFLGMSIVMNDQVDDLDLLLEGHHMICLPAMSIANFGRQYK